MQLFMLKISLLQSHAIVYISSKSHAPVYVTGGYVTNHMLLFMLVMVLLQSHAIVYVIDRSVINHSFTIPCCA